QRSRAIGDSRSPQASPSFTCGHILGCATPASRWGSTSSWCMRSMKSVETTKLSASTRIAYGAVIAAISPPATLGPATCATELVKIELRVAVDQVLAFDECWEVRLVADVEEDGEASDEELQREK